MPSITHQILVSLIRDNPTFGMHLLQQATGTALPKQASLRKTEAQFTDLKPPEYSADAAYLIENARGRPLGAVIFEVQLEPKQKKRRSWLQYVATCHAQLKTPVTLMAVALTESMARWCSEPYLYDPIGGNTFRPVVLGPSEIPRVTDLEQAAALPALAFLSVAAHGRGPQGEEVALAAIKACATLPLEQGSLFYDFIMSSLSKAAQLALEKKMLPKDYEPQSEWAKEQRAKGIKQGKQSTLLKLLGLKYGELPDAVATRIDQAELTELDRWLERILTAPSLDDVFA